MYTSIYIFKIGGLLFKMTLWFSHVKWVACTFLNVC